MSTSNNQLQKLEIADDLIVRNSNELIAAEDNEEEEVVTFYYYNKDNQLVISCEEEDEEEYGECLLEIDVTLKTIKGSSNLDNLLINLYQQMITKLQPKNPAATPERVMKNFSVEDNREKRGDKNIKLIITYNNDAPKIDAQQLITSAYNGSKDIYLNSLMSYQRAMEENLLIETVRDEVKDLRQQVKELSASVNKLTLHVIKDRRNQGNSNNKK